jgi:segregation and condensation protein B
MAEGEVSTGVDGMDLPEGPPPVEQLIEAVLMAAAEPVPPRVLAEVIEVPLAEVEAAISRLDSFYEKSRRGFRVRRVAGGVRLQVLPELYPWVERFAVHEVPQRLTPAAAETLAIIAYKQPISRAQIAAIRGVAPESSLRLLIQRGYVREVGRARAPGGPALFGTTDLFLEHLGINTLDELPPVERFLPEPSRLAVLERLLKSQA